jgi:class 3 adenylate cyclase
MDDKPDGGRSRPDRGGRVYLTTLHHDLRAPIGAIIGYAELLAEDHGPDAGPDFAADIERIRSSGRALLTLVDDLFDPGAIAAGTLDLSRVGAHLRHDLRTPLNHVIGYSEMLAEEAEDDDQEALAADLNRIRDSGMLVLRMIDEILARASGDEGPESEGAAEEGLSDVAVGVVEELETFERSREERAQEPGRILVVDDNELNRDMLARRVRGEGHEVRVAEDGRAALELMAREQFDAVLLDIIMPGMNGYEALQRMKADPLLRDIPVIMISALNEIESAVRCIQMGAEDYLPKPFNPTLLKARLGACLEQKRLRDREALHLARIEEEQRRSDDLLHVIFPDEIVQELKTTNAVRPRRYEDVGVLFTDIVDFTRYSDQREPEDVIDRLQTLVREFEEITARHGMEKIKTIGDSFMAAAGLLRPVDNPVLACVECGLEMIEAARALPPHWDLRVGVHRGPLVGGVLGQRQYLFDVIGDTVNTASRVEQHGQAGAITLSAEAWTDIADRANGETLGTVEVKGKGRLQLMRFVSFR